MLIIKLFVIWYATIEYSSWLHFDTQRQHHSNAHTFLLVFFFSPPSDCFLLLFGLVLFCFVHIYMYILHLFRFRIGYGWYVRDRNHLLDKIKQKVKIRWNADGEQVWRSAWDVTTTWQNQRKTSHRLADAIAIRGLKVFAYEQTFNQNRIESNRIADCMHWKGGQVKMPKQKHEQKQRRSKWWWLKKSVY